MTTQTIDYEELIQRSLLGVVRNLLIDVSKNGLPGLHHFYITFASDHPGVSIPYYLKEQYPETLTIILQHEFWDLEVFEDRFEITLSFNTIHEHVTVPFNALTNFVDPHAKYGLQFTPFVDEPAIVMPVQQLKKKPVVTKKGAKDMADQKAEEESEKPQSNVVALDAFRRKS